MVCNDTYIYCINFEYWFKIHTFTNFNVPNFFFQMAQYNEYEGHPEEPDGHILRLRAHVSGSTYGFHDLFSGINIHICCLTCENEHCFWFCYSGTTVEEELEEHIHKWHRNLGGIQFECDLQDHPADFFNDVTQFVNHLRMYRGQVDNDI